MYLDGNQTIDKITATTEHFQEATNMALSRQDLPEDIDVMSIQ